MVGTGLSGYLLVKQLLFPSSNFSILNFIIFVIAVTVSLFVGLVSLCVTISGSPLAVQLNELFQLETSLRKTKKITIKKRIWSKKSENKSSIDFIGILLNATVYILTAMPFAIPFVMILGLDPLYFIFRDLHSDSFDKSPFLVVPQFLIRMVVQTYLAFGACRTLAFAMILAALGAKIVLSCVAGIRNYSETHTRFILIGTFKKALNLYAGYYVLIESLGISLINSMALGILLGGLVGEILTVFALVRMSYLFVLAFPVYIIGFIAAVGMPIVAHVQLPEAVNVYVNTLETLRIWKLATAMVLQTRYYHRVLQALRPCSIYAGFAHTKLFPLRKSTTTTYYSTVIYYVITVLISVPEFDVKHLITDYF